MRAAALFAGCVLACATVVGCSSADEAAPAMQDVRALLARHGAAVLHHDRTSFLADLDKDAKAASFYDAQAGEFDNLRTLPLTTWSYTSAARTDDRDAERAASARYGTSAIIVHITLRYALRGVDPVPTGRDLWWTFVRHDGRVVVAGDDGLANAGGLSWQGPWDFGPLDVVHGAHSLVLGHVEDAVQMRALAATVDAAVPAVSQVWGDAWTRDVGVVVPASPAEFTAQVGRTTQATTAVAALAISDGQDPVTGQVRGQRLVVNPGALRRLSTIGQQITIRHEVTHIADAASTTDASPRWLVEGFADYVGNLGTGQQVTTIAAELRADVLKGKVPASLPTDTAFDTAGEAAQAYEGAWLACRLIAARAGRSGLVQLYRLVGASSAEPDDAVAAGLGAVLHESVPRFTAQWRAYLSAELT